MFERFTQRARQTVVLAQEGARSLQHNYIGTEDILLGLLREEERVAARVLVSLDVTVDRVWAHVLRMVGSGEELSEGEIHDQGPGQRPNGSRPRGSRRAPGSSVARARTIADAGTSG